MNWEYYFSAKILARGKDYQKAGRVRDLDVKENIITAQVNGLKRYRVKITLLGTKRMALSCTCPYALDGHNCKHMAAVLYEYEEHIRAEQAKIQAKKAAERIPGTKLFPATEQRKSSFYNMNKIASDLTFQKDDVLEAERLVREKKLIFNGMTERFEADHRGASRCAEALAVPAQENSRGYYVRIRFEKTKINVLSCNLCSDQGNGYRYDPIKKTGNKNCNI